MRKEPVVLIRRMKRHVPAITGRRDHVEHLSRRRGSGQHNHPGEAEGQCGQESTPPASAAPTLFECSAEAAQAHRHSA